MTFSNFDILSLSLIQPVAERNPMKRNRDPDAHISFCLFLSLLDHRVNSYIQSKDITNRRNNTVSGHFFQAFSLFHYVC